MHRTESVELTCCVLVTDEAGRILVEDRLDPEWGGLFLPGGHVEPGESFVRAAIREVQEETGLTIESPRLCGLKQFPTERGRYLVVFFRTDRFSGSLRSSEEGPVFWCAPEDLDAYRLTAHFKEVLTLCQSPELSEMLYLPTPEGWVPELL